MKTFAINSGVPERAVDKWVGHERDKKSVQATYYHLNDEQSQKFMAMIPFGVGKPAANAGNHGGAQCTQ